MLPREQGPKPKTAPNLHSRASSEQEAGLHGFTKMLQSCRAMRLVSGGLKATQPPSCTAEQAVSREAAYMASKHDANMQSYEAREHGPKSKMAPDLHTRASSEQKWQPASLATA